MVKISRSDLEVSLNQAFDLLEGGDTVRARLMLEVLQDQLPSDPAVAFGCGAAAMQEKDFGAAVNYLREAILLAPGVAVFHETLGKSLAAQGRPKEAEDQFRHALEISPDMAESRANLALIEVVNGNREEAVKNLTAAVDLRPDDPEIRIRFGSLLWNASRFEEALVQFEAARKNSADHEEITLILMQRNHTLARAEMVDKLIGTLSADISSVAEIPVVAGCQLPVIAQGQDDIEKRWSVYENSILSLAERQVSFGINDLPKGTFNFYAAYQNRDVRRTQQVMAEYYQRSCPELEYVSPHLAHGKSLQVGEKIKIGFVSAYLSNHTIGKLYGGLVGALNDDLFDITIFADGYASDEITTRLRDDADRFIVLPGSLQGKREAIECVAPDILFYPDIGMSTETYFLAFSRLAFVQCAGLGHPVTTGIPAIDYYISGADIEPVGAEKYYTEKLITLPSLPFTVWPINIGAETPPLRMNFASGKTLYVCVQSLFKVHPDFDEILRGILEHDENGVIVFIEGMPGWSDALHARWTQSMPRVANRIHFIKRLNQTEFLALIHCADILLDTVHFCGGNTTAETLGMGKIVITWPGDYAAGRVSAAYYRRLGIEDAIVSSSEAYIELAVSLAQNTKRRTDLEKKIALAAPILFDHQEVGSAYEAFFESALMENADNVNSVSS